MPRYRSVPEPRMYLVAFLLAALTVLLVYFQVAVEVEIVRRILLVLSSILFLLMLVSLFTSDYNYILGDDWLRISYMIPVPHRRYHLGYLKSIIELSVLDNDDLEARVEDLRRSSGGRIRDHSKGDLVDCLVLFFKDDKKVDLVLISPRRKLKSRSLS